MLSSQRANGLGLSAGLTLSADAGFCPFCVTIASASLNFNLGSQISQTVTASPDVTYGGLVWYSKTQTYSASDPSTLVLGSSGNVANTFNGAPGGLGLVNGDTFYMNISPVVEISMPIVNDAQVTIPASITASWDVFGDGGSATYPLGNLFTLGNGGETVNFDASFYGGSFF